MKKKQNRWMHYLELLQNKSYWTWSNFIGVFQAYFRKTKYEYMGFEMPKYIFEQVKWREIKAKNCIDNITCLNCDCYIKERILEDRGCSIMEGVGNLVGKQEPCYPDMMNKKEWKIYKITNKIEI